MYTWCVRKKHKQFKMYKMYSVLFEKFKITNRLIHWVSEINKL